MKNLYTSKNFVLTVLFCCTAFFAANAQTKHYVKADAEGENNGSNWANAYTNFQTAINAAADGDSVFVAGYTTADTFYQPVSGESFYMREGVKIYGGFAGYETSLAQRNLTAGYTSILKGNGTHVIDNYAVRSGVLTAAAVLDGFTITGGNAAAGNGGGMHNNNNISPTLANCIFTGNSANAGGGLAVSFGYTATITNCTFSGNTSTYSGGGMYIYGSSPTLVNCTFSGNTAGNNGGAIVISYNSASPTFVNCLFSGNTASNSGGAIYNNATLTVTNCTIWGNSAAAASGIRLSEANATISNCIIYGNNVSSGSNTIHNYNNSSTINVAYSLVEGGYTGTGNIDANPQFVDAPNGNFRLTAASPAVNAGTPDVTGLNLGSTDIAGNSRVQKGRIDMGAYESSYFNCTPYATTLYVDANIATAGNGNTWATAFKNLQDALIAASECSNIDSILVAKGTYYPSAIAGDGTGDRDRAFVLVPNVKILGGYPTGGGTRNITANRTILSGDFNNDDAVILGSNGITAINSNTENAYHVVLAMGDVGTALLDGFTIQGGNAYGSGTITVNGQTPARDVGGGVYTLSSSPTVSNCTFRNNAGNYGGAGMFNRSSSAVIDKCLFLENLSANRGAGIMNQFAGAPTIKNCVFTENRGAYGGGIYNTGSGCNPLIINSVFTSNTGTVGGGGVFNSTSAAPVTTNCTFYGNIGGTSNGGAVYNESSSAPQIRNSIIWGNGTAITNNSATPVVSYSIVEGGYIGTENINANPNFVDAGYPIGTDNIWGTADDGLKLSSTNAAINKGNNAYLPVGITTDITGALRIQQAWADMGAYESGNTSCPNYTAVYVDSSKVVSGNGNTWATAFKTLDEALLAVAQCSNIETVFVAKGTYYPTVKAGNGTQDRDRAFVLPAGVKLMGGYNSSTGVRDIAANPTILSGDFNRDDVISGSAGTLAIANNTENAYHVVIAPGASVDATSVLDGFTVRGGNADGSGSISVNGQTPARDVGGGLYVLSASPTINNCTFTGNTAKYGGGGVFNRVATALFDGCVFSKNLVTGSGGGAGMFNQANSGTVNPASPTIKNSTFNGNRATNGGGGMYNQTNNPVITNCTFSGNKGEERGGGMYNSTSSSPTITNSIFSQNTSNSIGGGICNINAGTSPVVTNCVFTANAVTGNEGSSGWGGGIACLGSSSITITNSIFTQNTSSYIGGAIYVLDEGTVAKITNCSIVGNTATLNGGGIHTNDGGSTSVANSIVYNNSTNVTGVGTTTVTYSLVEGGYTGEGNVNVNPLFVNSTNPAGDDGVWGTADDGLALQGSSPAINAGNNTLYIGLTADTKDLEGNDRVYKYADGGLIDMGAYEYQGDPTTLPVSLVDFTVKNAGNSALLQWQTVTESNNQKFVIYRRGDNGEFVKIGEKQGTGNSVTPNNYVLHDESPFNGINYYKLVQVDNDGKEHTLDIKSVIFDFSASGLKAYPNPTYDLIAVSFSAGDFTQLQITDLNGKVLQNININATENSKIAPLGIYPAGTYIIRLKGNGDSKSIKVVKR